VAHAVAKTLQKQASDRVRHISAQMLSTDLNPSQGVLGAVTVELEWG
jgi:hypothetical protein